MKVADFLSINCPMTPKMAKFLKDTSLFYHNAIVVNTARGGLVDDEALIAGLKSGRVLLRQICDEPNLHPKYRTLDNVVLLPHVGSATVETRNAMGFRALKNLDAFFAGGTTKLHRLEGIVTARRCCNGT